MKNNLSESQISDIVNETVNDVLHRIGVVNEMSVPLKNYKNRVDGLRFQLVENWCLCKWCQIFSLQCTIFAHWMTELKACIDNLKFLDINNDIDKRKVLVRMLIKDYDYDNSNMIERIVRGKFENENIRNVHQKVRVCSEFADNIEDLIDVISMDSIDTNTYLQETFM